ncbi:MAG: radical SAM family heme chaperone HemW [Clostridiales bacterium]|nr:radical SAM family heme chaperone HemW [Clostridiales bacterium]
MRTTPQKQARPLGLYLHIPFCASKCPYCDFYSVTDLSLIDRYLAALLRQMAEYAPQAKAYVVDSVFVGGGTPSLLSRPQWDRLFKGIHKHFKLAQDAEITVEANPDSVDRRTLVRLRKLGVNRLSIGAQSFDDAILQRIGRIHSAGQILQAVEAARKARFENLNLDLMFGLPDQSPAQFFDSLQQAFDLGVQHLSAYGLRVEEDTPFGRLGDLLTLPDEDTWAGEYLELIARTRAAGYYQYEISNFCLPGHASRHNLKYWTLQEYLGLGPGAHSYLGNRRFAFAKDLLRYCQVMESGEGSPVTELFEVAPKDALADSIMLSLRLTRGIDTGEFAKTFRRDFERMMGDKLNKYLSAGLMVREGTRYRLTPQGFCVSNSILADLIDVDAEAEAARLQPAALLRSRPAD